MIGPAGTADDPESWGWFFDGPDHHGWAVLARGKNELHDHGMVSIPCPYGVTGDRLWVRETWARLTGNGHRFVYRADGEDPRTGWDEVEPAQRPRMTWTPSIHMPRVASRITLEVTDVRVERLQAISEEDARAEGIALEPAILPGHAAGCFSRLWDEINGKRAPWSSNPWVWAVTFRMTS